MKYAYDEDGVTFYFFILTCAGLWVIPKTIALAIGRLRRSSLDKTGAECHCAGCTKKAARLAESAAKSEAKGRYFWAFLALGWIVFCGALLAVCLARVENRVYDPFEVLGVSPL